MIPLREWAEKNGLRLPTVASQFARGAIEGAQLVDGKRMVPENAPVPPMKAPKPTVSVPGMITVSDWARDHAMTYGGATHRLEGHIVRVNGVRMVRSDLPDALPGMITVDEWRVKNGLSASYTEHLIRNGDIEVTSWLSRRFIYEGFTWEKRKPGRKKGWTKNS